MCTAPMALEDTFEHEGIEIGETPHELLLRRGHRGGGSTAKVPPEAAAAITALGLHIWPLSAQKGW